MEAINTRLSQPIAAPESPKPVTPVKGSVAEKNQTDTVDLSPEAQKQLPLEKLAEQKEKTQTLLQKAAGKEDAPAFPPPPLLGEEFYEANQARAEKSKAELEKTQERLDNFAQYTNQYLAQVAYAKTLADQPIPQPQPSEPKDIIDRLNLFS